MISTNLERNLLVSILQLTQKGPVSQEIIAKESRICDEIVSRLLVLLREDRIVSLENGLVKIDENGRIRLSIKAISLGSDSEQLSKFLSWQEFESISAAVLEYNGFSILKNVRFKSFRKGQELGSKQDREYLPLNVL